jgi:8-oxo-dGTP pyrophosphatase MutT (NUDIX family)
VEVNRSNDKAAGIAIIWNGKVLLEHPTDSKWYSSYSIPKGGIEDGEATMEAAIRETLEETGISVRKDQLDPKMKTCTYRSGKKVFYYICRIENLSEVGLDSEIVPKKNLQLEEVDWAGFVDLEEAKKRIMKSQISIIEQLERENLLESKIKSFKDFLGFADME